ncbi:Ribosomal protein S18 acetylase RimI [Abditibacterium utsteinense]|uniref:Ribosomal protein S18 acetylase RimI n=1 Tax=Abditibacterium utsteinense TaxID=1960156 RepID=A0A2S8SQM5_9BACT|nr:Ribosomal protein S18 acetylase RimI [Abditibacterium utsteinense]
MRDTTRFIFHFLQPLCNVTAICTSPRLAMTTFLIRPAAPDDAEVLADFNLEMARETERKPLERDVVLSGVRGVLENQRNGFYFLANDTAGNILGALLVTFEWSDWRDGLIWWIQSVYVVPHWRGRGVYRALYAQVKTQAQSAQNVKGLRLYVERENFGAQQVYARLGMSETPYRIFEEMF